MQVEIIDPNGNRASGSMVDGAKTKLVDIDPTICQMATGLGNAMFIGSHPAASIDKSIIVWKITKNPINHD
jgi:hypothetical protein